MLSRALSNFASSFRSARRFISCSSANLGAKDNEPDSAKLRDFKEKLKTDLQLGDFITPDFHPGQAAEPKKRVKGEQ